MTDERDFQAMQEWKNKPTNKNATIKAALCMVGILSVMAAMCFGPRWLQGTLISIIAVACFVSIFILLKSHFKE